MISAYFSGEKVVSGSQEAFLLYEKSRLGEKQKQKIEYADVEALFLIQEGRMKVFSGKKEIIEENLLKKFKKSDKRIEIKLAVFTDLKKKGYIVKTAFKFGAEFRVYEKGVKPGDEHAKWILYSAKESDNLSWYDFAAKSRVAHSTKKNFLLAVLDDEGDVTYYEICWLRL